MRFLKDKILYCLRAFPETRNSDITLQIKIWETYHRELLPEPEIWNWFKKNLYRLPREKGIFRERCEIVNPTKDKSAQFVPTEWKFAKIRKFEREEWEEARKQDLAPGEISEEKGIPGRSEDQTHTTEENKGAEQPELIKVRRENG